MVRGCIVVEGLNIAKYMHQLISILSTARRASASWHESESQKPQLSGKGREETIRIQ